MSDASGGPRSPRSFVRRAGRMTNAQRRAVERYWPQFGLDPQSVLDPAAVFGRRAPLGLEIGFGMGDTLAELAREHPAVDYIGIEVHEPGLGRLLKLAVDAGLTNLRLMRADAVVALEQGFSDASLDFILIYFPDPWPKKRHHKRRLVQPAFANLVCSRLRVGGRLQLASDWQDYAEYMLSVLDDCPGLRNAAGRGCFSPRPLDRPQTKFERRGLRLGHQVYDLIYVREDEGDRVGD